MFHRNTLSSKTDEVENPFLLSFSDLLAGLLALFILVLIITLFQLEKRKAELDRRNEELRISKQELIESLKDIKQVQDGVIRALAGVSQRENSLGVLLVQIQKDLESQGINVVIAENGTVLRITENQLQFALGRYDIPPAQVASASVIGRTILNALKPPENRSLLDTVFVEGHTDSVSNAREMGNWGLSTYRAISLWNFWTENPGELFGLKELQTIPADSAQAPKPLFSVSGYADTRSTHGPLDGLNLKDDRPEDRRIDLRFTLASSEKKDLKSLNENLAQLEKKTDDLIQKLEALP